MDEKPRGVDKDGHPGWAAASLMEDIRQKMLRSVDEEMTEREQMAWTRGTRAAQAMQTEDEQSFSSLVDSLAEVRSAQHSLEAENQRLRHVITALAGRISQMGATAAPSPWSLGWTSPLSDPGPAPGIPLQATPAAPAFLAPSVFPPPAGEVAGAMEELWRATTSSDDISPHLSTLSAIPLQPQVKLPLTRQVPLLGAKVSLADGLGIGSPATPTLDTPSTARSAAGSEASSGCSSTSDDVDAYVFGLTLRLADSAELGLTTSQSGRDRHLRIEGVLPGGAADAWNRQCGSSGAAEKVLIPGDKIVSVNDVAGDPQAMLLECSSRRLLRLQIVRVGSSAPSSPREVELPAADRWTRSSISASKASWKI